MRAFRTFGISLLVVCFFIAFYLGALVLSWIVLPIVGRRGAGRAEQARLSQHVVRSSFRLFHHALVTLRLLDGDAWRAEIALPPGPCVLIANHPTLIDVTAILANLDSVACVVKSPLFRSPAIGGVLRQAWYIVGGAGDPGDGARVLREAQERLARGMHVLIFPEGTRSPPGGLGKFRRGAFELACRAGVPVVPLLLHASPPFLHKDATWYALPEARVRLTLSQLPSLDPANWTGDSRAMAADCEQRYRQALRARMSEDGDGRDGSAAQPEVV